MAEKKIDPYGWSVPLVWGIVAEVIGGILVGVGVYAGTPVLVFGVVVNAIGAPFFTAGLIGWGVWLGTQHLRKS